MGKRKRCAFEKADGSRCRKAPATGSKFCGLHDEDRTPRCSAKAKSTGKRCRRPAIRGGTVCTTHGGRAKQVQRAALERQITSPRYLEDRVQEIMDQGLDEVEKLGELMAFGLAALDEMRAEVTRALEAGESSKTVGAWFSALERWASRVESVGVNRRKLRLDARFRKLAEDLVTFFADWVARYVPEHRRDAALRELEQLLARVDGDRAAS